MNKNNNSSIEKKILMVSGVCWNSPQQIGDHQLARQFLKAGWKVAFLSDPLTPFHLLKGGGADFKVRFRNYLAGGENEWGGQLWNYVPASLVMPFNAPVLKSAWVYDNWQKLTIPNLVRKVREAGFGSVDLVYLRTPHQAFWLKELDYNLSIYRIADFDHGFRGNASQMQRAEQALVNKADLTVYTAETLRPYVQALCPQATCYLPNGVDFDHFDQQQSCPPEYSGLEGPIALYVGTLLKERFDFELVNMAAKRLPHVQFVIIGPGDHAKMDFDKRDNIHILGPRAHTDVPAYMQHADVGLIPFDVKKSPDLINCTNPLKLYEYLAAGIPVVSVSWEEVRKINSPALLSDNDEDFIAKISVALERKWDKNSLKDFSRRRDWENRFDELLETVEQLSARQQ